MLKRDIAGFAVLSALIGSMWIPERALTGEIPMGYAVAIANSTGAVVALLLCLLLRMRRPRGREWFFLLMVCCAFMASVAVLYMAQILPFHLSPAEMLTLHAASPLAVVLLTPLWLGTSVPRRAMAPMIAGLAAVLLLLSVSLEFSWSAAFDTVFGFIAILCTVSAFLYASRVLRDVPPLVSACAVMISMSALAWPLAIASDPVRRSMDWSDTTVTALGILTFLVCGGAVLGFWLLQRMNPYKLVMVRIAAPVVTMAEAWILMRGQPGWQVALGAVIALASVIFVLRMRDNEEADEPLPIFSIHARERELD